MSQAVRHQSIFSFPLNSIETALKIINTKNKMNGIYIDDRRVAYITGKPANMAPPPITSQTSFPSQTGPTAFIAILRLSSFLKNRCQAPAPKSNPSRTAYPENNPPTTKNQRVG